MPEVTLAGRYRLLRLAGPGRGRQRGRGLAQGFLRPAGLLAHGADGLLPGGPINGAGRLVPEPGGDVGQGGALDQLHGVEPLVAIRPRGEDLHQVGMLDLAQGPDLPAEASLGPRVPDLDERGTCLRQVPAGNIPAPDAGTGKAGCESQLFQLKKNFLSLIFW